jgi:hypothetical protein
MAVATISLASLGPQNEQTMLTVLTQILLPFVSHRQSGKQLNQFGWVHEMARPSETKFYFAEQLVVRS